MHPRTVIFARRGRAARRVVKSFLGPSGGTYFMNTVTTVRRARGVGARPHQGPAREPAGLPRRSACDVARRPATPPSAHHSISLGARSRGTTSSVASEGEGAECSLFGLYEVAGAQHVDHHTSIDHVEASLHEPRALQGGARRPRPRGLRRPHRGPPRRAEDERDADEQEPPALEGGAGPHEAAARDLRQRREVQARRDASGSSTRTCSSTCARAASAWSSARRLLIHAFASEIVDTVKVDAVRSQIGGCMALIRGGRMTSAVQNRPAFDVRKAREDFPILKIAVHGKPLVYLDNAATTQKPQAVIDAILRYYEATERQHPPRRPPPERGRHAHVRSDPRVKVQRFLNAADAREIIFTRGTTEAINLVAAAACRTGSKAGDEVLITAHGAPLQHRPVADAAATRPALVLRSSRSTTAASCILEEFEKLPRPRTKLVSVTHVSNALGTINPVQEDRRAGPRQRGAVLIDGAQAVAHLRDRRPRPRLRLLRLLRPQAVRPHRHRRPLRQGRDSSRPCRPTRAAAT